MGLGGNLPVLQRSSLICETGSHEFLPCPGSKRGRSGSWLWSLQKASSLDGEAPESPDLKLATGALVSSRHLSLHFLCQTSLPEGGRDGRRGEELGPCPVSPEYETWTCSRFGSERGPQNPMWPYGPAPEFEPTLRFLQRESQGAKCIIKWQKGSALLVKDNGGNLLDGL